MSDTRDRQARLDGERVELRAAADRLLNGTPTRTGGALTATNLAAEAGLPRHRLYEHHAELVDGFHASAVGRPLTPNQQALRRQLDDAHDRIRNLEQVNNRLSRQITTLAAIITELELTREQRTDNIVSLPRHHTRNP